MARESKNKNKIENGYNVSDIYGRIAPPPAEVRRTMHGAGTECGQFHKSPPSETFVVISVKANKFECGEVTKQNAYYVALLSFIFRI